MSYRYVRHIAVYKYCIYMGDCGTSIRYTMRWQERERDIYREIRRKRDKRGGERRIYETAETERNRELGRKTDRELERNTDRDLERMTDRELKRNTDRELERMKDRES